MKFQLTGVNSGTFEELSDTPVSDLAEASKTARTLVVVLLYLYTACIGK